jgi:hypothetical protein
MGDETHVGEEIPAGGSLVGDGRVDEGGEERAVDGLGGIEILVFDIVKGGNGGVEVGAGEVGKDEVAVAVAADRKAGWYQRND